MSPDVTRYARSSRMMTNLLHLIVMIRVTVMARRLKIPGSLWARGGSCWHQALPDLWCISSSTEHTDHSVSPIHGKHWHDLIGKGLHGGNNRRRHVRVIVSLKSAETWCENIHLQVWPGLCPSPAAWWDWRTGVRASGESRTTYAAVVDDAIDLCTAE
jgi:hypothetical protein